MTDYLMFIFIVFAYLLGSVSSAIVTCRIMKLPDPRTVGSKNPGATNVQRHGGNLAAFITLLGDAAKGFVPVMLAKAFHLSNDTLPLVGLAAFLGHLFPLFFKFKGGKGVATTFGIAFALNAYLGLLAMLTWLMIAFVFRISSLSALIMSIMLPVYSFLLGTDPYTPTLIGLTIMLMFSHHENIKQLWRGTESKIQFKKNQL